MVRESESPNDPVASTSTLPVPVEARLPYPGQPLGSDHHGQSLARSGSSSNSPYESDLALPVPPASFAQPTYSIQGPSPPGSQPSPLYAISPYSVPTNTSTSTLATSSGSPDDYRQQKDLFPLEPSSSSHLPISSGLPAPQRPPSAGFADTQLPPPPAPPPHLLQYPPIGRNSAVLSDPAHSQATSSVRTVQVAAPAPIAASSNSAFKYGGGFGFAQDTLAPGLSRTGSFTKDEVLASEVLRDLMRSPLGLPPTAPHPSPMSESPWHGAKAAARAQHQQQQDQDPQTRQDGHPSSSHQLVRGNEAASLVDGQGWGMTTASFTVPGTPAAVQVSNKLETSPAAQALASYFNQGGVGGITALDLGFPTEPSLFPDFLFQPQIVHEEDKRYWLPAQKFCLGCTFFLLYAVSAPEKYRYLSSLM